MSSTQTRSARGRVGGPPLVVVASATTGLFLASLIVQAVLGGGDMFPSPFADGETIRSFFSEHSTSVRWSGALQFASAVPLAIFGATASHQVRAAGARVAGVNIAFAGGLLASAFLGMSGLLQWILSRESTAGEAQRVIHDATFLTGGPASVVFFGLMIAGLAVPALILRLLRRWLAIAGLVIAAAGVLSTLALVAQPLLFFVPIGRFLGLAWIIVAGVLLPTGPPRNRREASAA